MDINDLDLGIQERDSQPSLVSGIKKNCRMCSAYRTFHPNGPQKPSVQKALKSLYMHYSSEYERLRKEDSVSGARVKEIADKKRFILDLIDECGSCSRETGLVGERIKKL